MDNFSPTLKFGGQLSMGLHPKIISICCIFRFAMFLKSVLQIGTRTLAVGLPIVQVESHNVPEINKYLTANLTGVNLIPDQTDVQISNDIRHMQARTASAIFNVVDYKGFFANSTLLSGKTVVIDNERPVLKTPAVDVEGKKATGKILVRKAAEELRLGSGAKQRKLNVSAKINYVLPNSANEFDPKTCDSYSFTCRLSDHGLKTALSDDYRTLDYYRAFDNETEVVKQKKNCKTSEAARNFVPLPSLETVDKLLG